MSQVSHMSQGVRWVESGHSLRAPDLPVFRLKADSGGCLASLEVYNDTDPHCGMVHNDVS